MRWSFVSILKAKCSKNSKREVLFYALCPFWMACPKKVGGLILPRRSNELRPSTAPMVTVNCSSYPLQRWYNRKQSRDSFSTETRAMFLERGARHRKQVCLKSPQYLSPAHSAHHLLEACLCSSTHPRMERCLKNVLKSGYNNTQCSFSHDFISHLK